MLSYRLNRDVHVKITFADDNTHRTYVAISYYSLAKIPINLIAAERILISIVERSVARSPSQKYPYRAI